MSTAPSAPTLSIIVPVYNVEDYLSACIDSILGQTFRDFELILVDDGSTDRSGAICDEYARRDSRIRTVHQANAGVSAARNTGLDLTRGEFITFVDSDDEFGTPTTLEENMRIFRADSMVDVVQFPFVYEKSDISPDVAEPATYTSKSDMLKAFRDGGAITVCVWGKLYRATLWKSIRFPAGMEMCEDGWCVLDIICNTRKFYVSYKGCYHYRPTPGSSVLNFTPAKWLDMLKCTLKEYQTNLRLVPQKTYDAYCFFKSLDQLTTTSVAFDHKVELTPFVRFLNSHMPPLRATSIGGGKNKAKLFIIKAIGLNAYVDLYTNFVLHRKRRTGKNS